MIRGIEGGNARGARLQYIVLACFAGSVGEYEVVKWNACSLYMNVVNERGCFGTNDGMHAVAIWPSPSLPKNTEVLRDPLPLRAHVPMGEGEEEGCRKPKTQDAIGDLAVGVRRGRETLTEQGANIKFQ